MTEVSLRRSLEESIVPRFIATLIAFITLVSVLAAGGFLLRDRYLTLASIRMTAASNADRLAESLVLPVWNVDMLEIDQQVNSAFIDPQVIGVSLLLMDLPTPLLVRSRDAGGKLVAGPVEQGRGAIVERRRVSRKGIGLASLELVYSTILSARTFRSGLFLVALVLAAVDGTLALGLFLIMRRSIFRPLRAIERWAASVGPGGGLEVAEGGLAFRGEISSLRLSIERMVRLLSAGYAELEDKERELRSNLETKEALVQELFHRTRNSMQVVVSIISLKESMLRDEKGRSVLRDILALVTAMAMAQEGLSKFGDLSCVDLGLYLPDLVRHLVFMDVGLSKRISCETRVEPAVVLIDVAMPLGLAIAEFVTNSLVHAFPGEGSGTISLSSHSDGEGRIAVSLRDDGCGPPPGFDPRGGTGFGLGMLINLVENQLRGRVSFGFGRGFSCDILFDPSISERRV
jgi:two-component sensor histidine kinase